MILAAGLGKRMRPITATVPKPLIEVGGRALIDHALDRLERAGVEKAVVNVHYLPQLVRAHLAKRRRPPEVVISDERDEAPRHRRRHRQGAAASSATSRSTCSTPNSFWIEGARPNLDWLAGAWDDARMDVAPAARARRSARSAIAAAAISAWTPAGRLSRRPEREVAPFAYAGAAILHPAPLRRLRRTGAFSLNLLFDQAIEAERLFGVRMDGLWLHVGTPETIGEAEMSIADSAA